MSTPQVCSIAYRRSRFSTKLPSDRLYTPGHFWLREVEPGLWRVGITRFAQRMLGDLVEYGFEVKENQTFELGDIIGWIEAFKATSDIYSPADGTFRLIRLGSTWPLGPGEGQRERLLQLPLRLLRARRARGGCHLLAPFLALQ